ncbi:hypothetical protein GUJ93_ZPchr0014g47311 [Zizania palustris]|uniref:Uncharacterized protein n=1 Tax=Zizania palustris TaxID=103762 RepID=A0A8J5TKS4_ZIZPA|nr:hypothetical protein GUJ93_ZPchr0014g47311 [Zizania palustris]
MNSRGVRPKDVTMASVLGCFAECTAAFVPRTSLWRQFLAASPSVRTSVARAVLEEGRAIVSIYNPVQCLTKLRPAAHIFKRDFQSNVVPGTALVDVYGSALPFERQGGHLMVSQNPLPFLGMALSRAIFLLG